VRTSEPRTYNVQSDNVQTIERYGVIAVIRRENFYLTIRRSETVAAPNKICFPGGGIEKGETDTEALIRECREEINVAVKPIKQIWQNVTAWNVHLTWWEASMDEDAKPIANPREVSEIIWLTREEMLEHPDLLSSNVEFVERILTCL
jgi:8-oxo-dGTP diphosphatase